MDVIYNDKNGNVNHILCNDHKANQAFINEFQTNEFTLKLNSIMVYENELKEYIVEDGLFVLFDVEIRNNTNECIEIFKEDFMLCFNNNENYYPEDYFKIKNQFEDIFKINGWECKQGFFIFIVPKQLKKLDFFYTEFYDEEHYKEYHLRYKIEKSA